MPSRLARIQAQLAAGIAVLPSPLKISGGSPIVEMLTPSVIRSTSVTGRPSASPRHHPVSFSAIRFRKMTLPRRSVRSTASAIDGYKPARAQAVVEPVLAPEEFAEPEEDEFEQEEEVDDLELPNIVVEDAEEETAIPPEAEETEEQEEEEDLFYDEEEDEEEEDEDSWGARGRKKPKPGRQVKPPKPLKKPKREPRRGF